MNLDIIPQIAIAVFGCSAIWFVGRLEHWKRWGYILGLCSQPFWLWTTISHKQWGIVVLSFWYTYSWAQGVYNYWIKKPPSVDDCPESLCSTGIVQYGEKGLKMRNGRLPKELNDPLHQ